MQVGESRNRVGEEHHAKPADHDVELTRWERVALRVGFDDGDLRQTCRGRPPLRQDDQLGGDVHAEDAAALAHGGSGLKRELPAPAPDVHDPLARRERSRPQDQLAETAQHRVVPLRPGGPGRTGLAVPQLDHVVVPGGHDHSLSQRRAISRRR
jgi:hypothetical protein